MGEEVRSGSPIKAEYVRELRTKLDEGLAKLGLPVSAYADTPLNGSPNGTVIKKIHFEQLRDRSTRGTGVTGSGLSAYDFASARLDPNNRTGTGGVDLYSGNFNWSLPLLGLPGRAGLDLGLTLSYNSLVWTKSGNYFLFDGDWGWPAPGFRLGFPVVQGKIVDAQAGKPAYIMVTPSGGRVSLRQTGSPTVYESADSSYLQLTERPDGSLELFATDGTRMTFRAQAGAYKCEEVRDANGNFITVAYTPYGSVDHVTDTLGRLIDFEYYSDGYLKQITQTWHREIEGGSPSTETHRWAKFEYEDTAVNVNFPGGTTVFGPTGGQTFRALKKVTLADDSTYTFGYTSWGQVNVIENRAAGGGLLNRVRLDLPTAASTEQADCPRPAARRDWAAYWNGDDDGAPADAEEAVTSYAFSDGATWVNPDDNTPQAGRLGQLTSPDGTVYKEFAHSSGWDKGLQRLSEFWSGGQRKKWTSTAWMQDSEALPYVQNPRVGETNVYDSEGNRRRTTVSYIFWGLPEEVREYDASGTTVLRRTHTEYKASSVDGDGAYALRRIIGLPEKREVIGTEGGTERLLSRVTYEYDDEPGCLTEAGALTQHKAEYDANLKLRGNVCVARRWDVETLAQTVATRTGYNTAGSIIFTRDADGHQTAIEYATGAGALAYPTKVTDHDDFFSTIEYNYDTGAVTRAVNPKGAAVKTFYDSVGRRLKVKNEVDGGYTRWEYGEGGLFVKQWTKVDTDKDETFVISVTDGAGRGVGALREYPGEGTGYAASRTEYDPVNRVVRQYRPSEVSVDVDNLSNARAWVPAGEDAAPQGWPHSTTEYDWKGRPKRVVDLDGKDSLFDYSGCGCAGGELVTVKGKQVPIPGTGGLGRRTQRVYHDVLGRALKTEVLDWEGNVYSTTTTKYDLLDRPVRVRQYAGEPPSEEPAGEAAGYRTTTMKYDGHGRLKERHVPEQDDGGKTAYAYNDDDTLKSVTDARGVKALYGYDNGRHLVSSISYNLSNVIEGQNVQTTSGASFTYDAAGNRETMNDGFGTVLYTYDTLSRLQSEKRTFNDTANPAVNGVARELKYDYNLAGQLKSLTDPFGVKVNYNYDKAGQLTSVTPDTPFSTGGFSGIPVEQVNEFASGMKYRAWGALKSMGYGNGLGVSLGYTAEMEPDEFKVTGSTGAVMWSKYRQYDDGALESVESMLDHRFDRSYRYDHAGRLAEAFSGEQALLFVKPEPSSSVPYWMKYEYDVWGNTKKRENQYWSRPDTKTFDYDTHNRRFGQFGPLADYDAEGNVLNQGGEVQLNYDAAGRNRLVTDLLHSWVEQWHDGAGQMLKRREERHDDDGHVTSVEVGYYVRSTVLGGAVVSELNSSGEQVKSLVTGTRGYSGRAADFQLAEERYDAEGVNVGSYDPFIALAPPIPDDAGGAWLLGGTGLPSGRCSVDGMRMDCELAGHMLAEGLAVQCPNNDCGPRRQTVTQRDRQGHILASSSYLVTQGQAGWDGSLDGTYRVNSAYASRYDVGTVAGARAFVNFIATGPSLYGDSFYSELVQRDTTVVSRNAGMVNMGLTDIDALRRLMQARLDYGNCKQAVANLINQLSADAQGKNNAVSTDVMEIFNKMAAAGAIRINVINGSGEHPNGMKSPGGKGFSFTEWTRLGPNEFKRERKTWIYTMGAFEDSPRLSFEAMPFEFGITGIHEMIHQAGSTDLYGTGKNLHEDMDSAAHKLDSTVGTVDAYLNKNCLPPEMRMTGKK